MTASVTGLVTRAPYGAGPTAAVWQAARMTTPTLDPAPSGAGIDIVSPADPTSDEERELLSLLPSFRLLIAHGYSDMVTPYAVSRYMLDHLPQIGA